VHQKCKADVATLFQALLTIYGVFWAFAFVSLLSAAFAWKCFPETKGKTLIEIQAVFKKSSTTFDVDSKQSEETASLNVV